MDSENSTEMYKTLLEKNNVLENSVFVNVCTFDQARMAKDAGLTGVVVLFDDEYQMANIALAMRVVKELELYCVVQMRKGHTLEAMILQGCGVNLFNACVENNASAEDDLNTSNYDVPFMVGVDSLQESLNAIDSGCTVIQNSNLLLTVSELVQRYNKINEKISEFHKFRNANSIIKYSKENKISLNLLNYCADTGIVPCIHLAEGKIRNPLDAVLLIKTGYSGIILNEEIFSTRSPLPMLRTIVQVVSNYKDGKQILSSCTSLPNI